MQEQELSFYDLFLPVTKVKAITIIFFAGIFTFFDMLFSKFLWDDLSYIVKNPEIYTINLPLYFKANIFNNNGQYRPLTEVYFSFLYSLFSTNPFFYHAIQLLFHISTTILIFYLLKKFFKPALALLLSLLFLVHPMQVESVSYIASTGCILFLSFGLPALILIDRRVITPGVWILIGALLLISLLVKEAGLLVLIAAITFVALFNKKQVVKSLLVTSSSIAIYLLIRFGIGAIYYENRPLLPIARLNFFQRLINIPEVIFYYIKTFFFPARLSIDQQWTITTITFSHFFFPLFILCLIFIPIIFYTVKLLANKREEGKVYLFFLIWTIIGFGMYSQIISLDRTVADRWMYFPMVGLLGLIGCFISYLAPAKKYIHVIYYLLIGAICIFSLRTIVRNTNWTNGVTLYSHDSKYYTNYIIENDFAGHLIDAGDYKSALIHGQRSVEMFPFELNILNLGRLYELNGNYKEAEKYYQLALRSKTYYNWQHKHIIHTYTHLAKLLLIKGSTNEALTVVNAGLADYQNDKLNMSPALWLLSAMVNHKLGNRQEAIKAADQAHIALPNDTRLIELYNNLLHNKEIDYSSIISALMV